MQLYMHACVILEHFAVFLLPYDLILCIFDLEVN